MKPIRIFAGTILCCAVCAVAAARAQTYYVPSDYFPSQFEFRELENLQAQEKLQGPDKIKGLEHGNLMVEAGAQGYARRIYQLEGNASLTAEIVTLEDFRGAFSLLTLLGNTGARPGPPGEYCSEAGGTVCFAAGRYWVLVRADSDPDLARRVSVSIANRIGQHADALPKLIEDLPQPGYQPASLRYFLGTEAIRTLSKPVGSRRLDFPTQVEVAQADYGLDGQAGLLTLVNFPTIQMADDYFERQLPALDIRASTTSAFYSRRAGPLVAMLEGNFDPRHADRVLEPLKYQYSVKWIYDKNRNSSAGIWGLSYGVMSTVVRSIVLVSLLCLLSVLAGVSLALFRMALRAYAPHNFLDRPERTELIRLKIDED